jgi:Uma2 family endonuclease
MIACMDATLDRPWTTESSSNPCVALMGLLDAASFLAVQEMRLRIGRRIRYPDVAICAAPLDQTMRTLTDALAVFEVLSEDTATTDRVIKLIDYADVPSLRTYMLLEQTTIAATLFQREPGGQWVASAHTKGALVLAGLETALPLADLYRGLSFPVPE